MIEIAFRCWPSVVLADRKVIGKVQGEVDRGWQDKSADGCRAHVVGWLGIFVTLNPPRAGSISKMHRGVNNVGASRQQKLEAPP
jgi:hypothetical protein